MSSEVLDALQKLSFLLESEDVLEQTLNRVVELSVAVLPGCDAAGITRRIGGNDTTVATSDEYALEIDKLQYDSNQGPCLQALTDSEFYKIDAVSEESRWPEFCHRASEKGFGSSLSFPLNQDESPPGALNIYARTERAFDDTAIGVAEVFAKQAKVALHNAQIYTAACRLSNQLNEALESRDRIGQAKGILMEREGLTDQEAFDMLRTISQNTNVKIRDIAQRLIKEKADGH